MDGELRAPRIFPCCKKELTLKRCVNCKKVYHGSCLRRDLDPTGIRYKYFDGIDIACCSLTFPEDIAYQSAVKCNKRLKNQLTSLQEENAKLTKALAEARIQEKLSRDCEKTSHAIKELQTALAKIEAENKMLKKELKSVKDLHEQNGGEKRINKATMTKPGAMDPELENVYLWRRLSEELTDKNLLLIEKNKKLEDEMALLKDNRPPQTLGQTFAKVVSRSDKSSYSAALISPTPSIVVETKDKEVVDKLKEVMSKTVMKGNRIETSYGKVVIKGPDLNKLGRLRSKIGEELQIPANISKCKLTKPRVKVANIDSKIDQTTLQKDILARNGFTEEGFRIVHSFENRTSGKTTAIAETSTDTYRKIMETGKLYVGWQRCPVFNDDNVHVCFKCNGFNHNKKNCSTIVCYKCGDKHKAAECTSEAVRCNNCFATNKKFGMDHKTDH